jgi:phosphoribosylanthranilate isomerase
MGLSPKVKICGLQRPEDVVLACELGADYVGVVLTRGFGRSVTSQAAAEMLSGVSVKKVAVLVDESLDDALALAAEIDADVIQLHGSESGGFVEDLANRAALPIWKAVRARDVRDIHQAVATHRAGARGFLVEGWKDGSIGGVGAAVCLDPPAVRRAVPADRTFVLAGGLTPANVAEAAARFLPDVVDVSSGVESEPGGKNAELVRYFFQAVHMMTPRPERR